MSESGSVWTDVLESNLDALTRPALAEYWEGEFRDDEWGGRHRIVQDFAFLHAALAELTGDPDHRERAKEHLLDFGRGDHFASLLCGKAYELLRDDLSEAERDQFAAEWVAEVRGALDQYVGDPADVADWDQVSNHAIGACVYADYARHLFPAVAENHGYERWTDPVWECWWDRREFHEQASNYEGFAETFLIHWADLRGCADEFYATPSVRNMFERNLRVVTPGGIVTPYGDSGYHQHQCKWIAMFERVAADLDDGRFRDAAAAVRGYFREHVEDGFRETVSNLPEAETLYNGRLIYKNHLHEIAWLGLAALWHDPSVAPASRPEPAGRISRLPHGYVLNDADLGHLPADELVDGQVALTGGEPGTPDHTYLLLSVGPRLVHDHADAGAIQLLSRDDAVLLGSNGYLQRELVYHNAFYAQPADWERYPEDDHDRILPGEDDCRGSVETLSVDGPSSHCRVDFDRYHGLPLDLMREVILDANGGVTLLDRVLAHEDGYRGGPLFHAETVEACGDSSYRLRTGTLRSLGNVVSENPPGSLRVEVVHPDATVDVARPDYPPVYEEHYQGFPTDHYKRVWKRSYAARDCLAVGAPLDRGEETVFVTRLVPETDSR